VIVGDNKSQKETVT